MIPVKVCNRTLMFDFDHTKPVQRAMGKDLTNGAYEPATWQAILDTLKPGDRAIDVGAHVGVLTCLMAAAVGPLGKVDAFEPEPANRARLQKHLRMNNLTWVTVHAQAVSDESSLVTFYRCADDDGGHALWNPGMIERNVKSRSNPSCITVRTVRLDDVVRGTIRLIKSDTEGNDAAVMRGAQQIIERDHPVVISEIHRFGLKQTGSSEQAYRQWFREHGYPNATILLDHQPNEVNVKPETTVLDETVFNMMFAA